MFLILYYFSLDMSNLNLLVLGFNLSTFSISGFVFLSALETVEFYY